MALSDSGKKVSERHDQAKAEGKYTAGTLASRMKKIFPEDKITAKELAEHATEWHHSGFVPGKNAMGKTYFFPANVDCEKLRAQVLATREERNRPRYYFDVDFEKQGKRYIPRASFYECGPGSKPGKNATEITAEQFQQARKFDGEALKPYESFTAFFARMTA